MKYLKVKNKTNYFRDSDSKGIIIDDETGLEKAKLAKERINKKEQEIEELKNTVNMLKDMVFKLIEDKNGAD
jgi:hypothetical protein